MFQILSVSLQCDSKLSAIMAAIELRLSTKKDAIGKSQIIVKLTIGRQQRPCFKSGVFVCPEWYKPIQETKRGFIYGIVPPKKGRLNVVEVKEANEAKARVDNFVGRLTHICNVIEGSNEELTREAIDEAMTLMGDTPTDKITYNAIIEARTAHKDLSVTSGIDTTSFFGMMEYYLQKKQFSYDQDKGYRVLMRSLARYQSFVRITDKERKGFTLDIHTLDKSMIEDFFDYLANEKRLSQEYEAIFEKLLYDYPVEISPKHKRTGIGERGENTIKKMKKRLKAFFNWLNEKEYTTNKPFKGIEIKSEVYGTPYYLTLDERNIIADFDLSGSNHLQAQRDIFIFQCLIGCRVSDLLSMTESNLINGMIEYIPRKTKEKNPVVVRVPLNGRALALVEKYKGVDGKGRLFPFISSQKYNDAIKEVLTACGIDRIVTILNPTTGQEEQRAINEVASSHMARRTFIGNLYKKVKDPNLIGSLSGHSEGSRAFARYRDIDDEIKKEVVSLID